MSLCTWLRRWLGAGALALGVVGWASGCVKVEQNLDLKADGSGVIALRYGMSLEDLAEMEAMAKAQLEEGAGPLESVSPFDFDEAEVRKDFQAYGELGVTLEDLRTEVVDGWKFLSLRIAFTSLKGLGQTEFLSDRMVSLKKMPDGNYEFLQAAPPVPEGEDMGAVEGMMAEMMKGFRAVLSFRAPGEVVESNADRRDGRLVEWVFDLDRDPQALKRAQKMALRVVFRGEGLALQEYASPSAAR